MTVKRSTWFLTHRCNLDCSYCLTIRDEQMTPEVDTADALLIAERIAALGPEVVVLTGGEVTSRRDLGVILSRFKELEQPTVVVTNGTRPNVLDEPGLQGISCSVDVEPGNVTWKRRRDAPDDRAHKSVTGADLLLDAVGRGIDATASIVAHRRNAEQVPDLIRWLSARRVASFVSVLHAGKEAGWRFRSKDTDEVLLPEQATRLSRELVWLSEQANALILNDPGYLRDIAFYGSTLDWHCSVPSDLVVDSDGSILSCSDWWGSRCKAMNLLSPDFDLNEWRVAWFADVDECEGCFWQCIYQAESEFSSRVPGKVGA